MLGRYFRAISKSALKVFYAYPTYFDIRSDDETLKNVPPCISVAHALAKKVFPVPGGPYNNMPFQGVLSPTKT